MNAKLLPDLQKMHHHFKSVFKNRVEWCCRREEQNFGAWGVIAPTKLILWLLGEAAVESGRRDFLD